MVWECDMVLPYVTLRILIIPFLIKPVVEINAWSESFTWQFVSHLRMYHTVFQRIFFSTHLFTMNRAALGTFRRKMLIEKL